MQSSGGSGADVLVSGFYGPAGRDGGDEAGGEPGHGTGAGRAAAASAGEAEKGENKYERPTLNVQRPTLNKEEQRNIEYRFRAGQVI